MAKLRLKSIEDASVIRKFSVLFSLMSLFPFIIIASLFFYFKIKGEIKISPNLLFWSAFLVGVFAFMGFLGVRATLTKLIKVSQTAKSVLEGGMPKYIDIKTTGNNEVAQIAHAFNEVVQRLEGNIRELEKSKGMLQSVLSRIASGVSFTENINAFLDLILETTVGALDAKIGLLLLTDEYKNNELIIKSSYGLDEFSYQRDKRLSTETAEVVGWVIRQKKPLLIPRLQKLSLPETEDTDLAFQPPLISAPLIFQNRVIGAILVSGRKAEVNFEEDELIVLSNLSSQIALAIENTKLSADAQRTYLETITALALAVEARDVYSRGHLDRVGEYAIKIAQKLGLSDEQLRKIKEAAQLHDVGKIGISDDILRKPDILNHYEEGIMQQHPVIGEGIIVPLRGFSHLRDPIRHHHEWLNGEGYPDHLKGEQISLEARILTVADAFDAMTTDRPYRKGMNFEEAKQELIKYKDIRFDASIVDAFISCI